jgi:mRNA-degrading endonuclease RelE of RelBE toxin-antitoxin system
VDILDATPVLDIKPYLPWADTITGADGGFAGNRPDPRLQVRFSREAQLQCRKLKDRIPGLASLIIQILENDPRPGYHAGSAGKKDKIYGIRIYDLDVKWQVTGKLAQVLSLDFIR